MFFWKMIFLQHTMFLFYGHYDQIDYHGRKREIFWSVISSSWTGVYNCTCTRCIVVISLNSSVRQVNRTDVFASLLKSIIIYIFIYFFFYFCQRNRLKFKWIINFNAKIKLLVLSTKTLSGRMFSDGVFVLAKSFYVSILYDVMISLVVIINVMHLLLKQPIKLLPNVDPSMQPHRGASPSLSQSCSQPPLLLRSHAWTEMKI